MVSKVQLLLFTALLAIAYGGDVETDDDGVLVCTPENFDSVVTPDDDCVLVEWYAPWCPHCRALKKDYAKVAEKLKGRCKVGKVDASEHKKLNKKYGVGGVPKIKLFKKGEQIDYNRARDADAIISWVNENL